MEEKRICTHPRRLNRRKRALVLVGNRAIRWSGPTPPGVTDQEAARKLHIAQNEHDNLQRKIGGR